jgi:tetratricopeptide (TPR) repeat protein
MTRRGHSSQLAAQQTLQSAVTAHRAGRNDEAQSLYRSVLSAFPNHAGTLHLLGTLALEQGRHDEAFSLLAKAARKEPRNAAFQAGLAACQRALGRLADAEASYQRAIKLNPNFAEAHNNLGNLLSEQGRFPAAASSLRRALSAKPTLAEAHNNLGVVLEALGRDEDASGAFQQALTLRPDYLEATKNLARLSARHSLSDSVGRYVRLLEDGIDEAALWRDWAAALYGAGRLDEALSAYDQALALFPRNAALLNNRGVALHQAGRVKEALDSYRRALAIESGYADAHCNLGIALKERGLHEEAIACHDRALAIVPDFAAARHNRALTELTLGRFERAWADYLWRDGVDRSRTMRPTAPLPLDLRGRRFCVVRDQGLGDELFFLRFVPALRDRGAEIAYEPHPKLAELLRGHPLLDRLHAATVGDEGFDSIVSVADLPYLVGTVATTDVPPPFILQPTPARVERIRDRLAAFGPPPYVGVTWRAGTPKHEKLFKSVDPAALGRILASLGGTAVVLQRSPQAEESRAFEAAIGRPSFDASAANDDLVEMAAVLAALDDYVSVSNTNVHLCASLGKNCRVLVPSPAEFRWLSTGATSPWFPQFFIYRQSVTGDWQDALAHLAQDLLIRRSDGGRTDRLVCKATRS